MPRRSTRGPLDMDTAQPPTPALQTALPPSPAATPMPIRTASPAPSLLSPGNHNAPSTARTRSRSPAPRPVQLDLSLLLRPSLYAPVPTAHVAAPFLHPSHQPAPDTDLDTLLSHGRFTHAADKAADTLTSGSVNPSDTQKILDLLYLRLSSLVLCNQSPLAAKEAKPLSDLLARESSTYARPHREVFLAQVPWPLRLLLLKLQVSGAADANRRAIMGLYSLSSECRVLAQKARSEKDQEAFETWRSRLADLGVRVASELVDMGELETARRHLATLEIADSAPQEKSRISIRKALLLLKMGDVQAANRSLDDSSSDADIQHQVLQALTSLASADYASALSQLQSLASKHPSDPLITHNLAIAHLYSNDVTTASSMLESLITDNEILFPTLLLNLSTAHELRTEKARERKLEMVDLVAGLAHRQDMQVGGFEKGLGEFKLT